MTIPVLLMMLDVAKVGVPRRRGFADLAIPSNLNFAVKTKLILDFAVRFKPYLQ
jgi:hypothetical protein